MKLRTVQARRDRVLALLLVVLLVVACSPLQRLTLNVPTLNVPTSTSAPTLTVSPPTPAPTPSPSPTPAYTDLWVGPADLVVFPQPVYAGDRVSFRITVHNGGDKAVSDVGVAVDLGQGNPVPGPRLASGSIGSVPAHGEGQTTLEWVWDTTGREGLQTLSLIVNPGHTIKSGDDNPNNNHAAVSIDILPADARPPREAQATWQKAQSGCCTFHYISGTAAERDLGSIMEIADAGVAEVTAKMGLSPTPGLQVYLVPRVVGHGGFASGHITLSYLDRNYAAGELAEVLRHEATHALESQWARGGEHHVMMGEGLAVYMAGGHFKPEPIPERAAALLQINRYIPLNELATNFYNQQHEIGYLEAASFVQYLSENYGFDRLRELYSSFHTNQGDIETTVLDRALKRVYGRALVDLEADWLAYLRTLSPTPDQVRDLVDTIAFYDTVRAYQKVFDPWAYFQTPWLPDVTVGERRGIVADYYRHPNAPLNLALETMLIAADHALLLQDFQGAERYLEAVNAVIKSGGAFVDPLAEQYRAIVEAVAQNGYEALQIKLKGRIADVWGVEPTGNHRWLSLVNTAQGWQLTERA